MDKLVGTVTPVSTDKKIASICVRVKVDAPGTFKVSDIQIQPGQNQTQYNRMPLEQRIDVAEQMHFNFLARGNATMVVPYMSMVPYDTAGKTMPSETNYITTPMKSDLLIHKPFAKSNEILSFGPGVTGQGKRFELNEDVGAYTHCVYDGFTSRQYIGGVEKHNAFIGRELRLANGDSKFTLRQDDKRKSTGVLYSKKIRKEV